MSNLLDSLKSISGVLWSLASIIIASLVYALIRIILAHYLSPGDLGIYTIIFAIYYLFLVFASFGIGAGLTKYIAENTNLKENPELKSLISSGIMSGVLTSIITALILCLLSVPLSILFLHSSSYAHLISLISCALPFLALQKICLGIFNGFHKFKEYAVNDIALNILTIILTLVFVVGLNLGVYGAVLALLVSIIIISVASLFSMRTYFSFTSIHLREAKQLIYFGFFIVLANSVGYINSKLSEFIIGIYMLPADVGIYAVATTMIPALTLLPSAIQRITTPEISRYYAQNKPGELKQTIKRATAASIITSLGISLVYLLFGPIIITIFFGQEYLSAYLPLVILTIGYLVYSPYVSIGAILACINKVHLTFRITIIGTVVNVIINIILVPYLGMMGAAIATVLSLWTSEFIVLAIIKRMKVI